MAGECKRDKSECGDHGLLRSGFRTVAIWSGTTWGRCIAIVEPKELVVEANGFKDVCQHYTRQDQAIIALSRPRLLAQEAG
jgi:hypothetical protein